MIDFGWTCLSFLLWAQYVLDLPSLDHFISSLPIIMNSIRVSSTSYILRESQTYLIDAKKLKSAQAEKQW